MVNREILQGRLVADPELKSTNSGTVYTKFTVAWSEKYKERETSCFLNCTAWSGLAEVICNHFHKGKEIIIEGRLQTDKWQDKDGNNRSTISCTVDKINFCGSKSSTNSSQDEVEATPLDDDIPF